MNQEHVNELVARGNQAVGRTRHRITEGDIERFIQAYKAHAASSGGGESSKSFAVTMTGGYIVTDHGNDVYVGDDRAAAVAAYNAAP